MLYGLQKVNSVTLPDKKERAGIAGFGSGTCSFTKIAFNHPRFCVSFQSSRSLSNTEHLLFNF